MQHVIPAKLSSGEQAIAWAELDRPQRASLGFILFLLVNAVLFIRPAEILPSIEGWPIYEVLMIGCVLVTLPTLLQRISPDALKREPLTICVLGILITVVLSNLVHGRTWEARNGGTTFLKVAIYYLLLISTLDSFERLEVFFKYLVLYVLISALLAIAVYRGYLDIPALEPLIEGAEANEFGQLVGGTPRLRGAGIFHDPNDFSLVLVASIAICLYFLTAHRWRWSRCTWLAPLVTFASALALTRSRGGFLGLLCCLGTLTVMRLGWRRAIAAGVILLPAVFFVFGGRQTNINITDQNDTAQGRILLWRDGLVLFKQSPFFGIGYKRYAEEVRLVAHNSYLHSYVELGLLGATVFVGAFYHMSVSLWQLRPAVGWVLTGELRRLHPYLLAMLAGFAAGLFTLSRVYFVPTYLIMGVLCVYLRLSEEEYPYCQRSFSASLLLRWGAISVVCLVGLVAFVRVFAR